MASRRRAAHARWPTSVLAVARDPLGALMATLVAAAASAAMGVSPRCSHRVAIMSDESAELLQLDPERYVTARSCVELKHARVTADSAGAFLFSRWFTLCMLLIRAPHVLCTQQHSRLSSGRSVPLVVHDTEASNYSSPHTRPVQKERAQFIQVPRQNTSKRVPPVAFIHSPSHCVSGQRISSLAHACARRR